MSRTSKKLAVCNGNGAASDAPTQEEINEINKEHQEIVLASQSLLPRAIKLGKWFIECKARLQRGDWENWAESSFPKISFRVIKRYVMLAQHAEFLEKKFNLIGQGSAQSNVDFQQFTSIKEAEMAIQEIRGSSSGSTKKKVKQAVKKVKEIEIEAEVKEVAKGEEKANGEEMLFTERGIQIASLEAKEGESDSEYSERIEGDLNRIKAERKNPKEELRIKVQNFIAYLRIAEDHKQDIKEWMSLAELSPEDLEYAIRLSCLDCPEYEIPATQALLEVETV